MSDSYRHTTPDPPYRDIGDVPPAVQRHDNSMAWMLIIMTVVALGSILVWITLDNDRTVSTIRPPAAATDTNTGVAPGRDAIPEKISPNPVQR